MTQADAALRLGVTPNYLAVYKHTHPDAPWPKRKTRCCGKVLWTVNDVARVKQYIQSRQR